MLRKSDNTSESIYPIPENLLNLAKHLAADNGIVFHFIQGNDMQIDIAPTDLLFIDSLHTYCPLTYELEKFSSQVNKFIAMHDTEEPWGGVDDSEYKEDRSEYPPHINRQKRGLAVAVGDFLTTHPEWGVYAHYANNHGFTILKRID